MNQIEFKLEILKDEKFEHEGIVYSNCAFIKLLVDGIDLLKQTEDKSGVAVWDELRKTKDTSGDFLLLTCVCGIADDAGFDLITVARLTNVIKWIFHDGTGTVWEFNREDYDLKLQLLGSEIEKLTVVLEPTKVLFPEG